MNAVAVPVIAVFTKYDQFKRNIRMHLQDHPNENMDSEAGDIVERRFQEDYQSPLGEGARFVRLESGLRCKYIRYLLMCSW